MLRYSFVLMLLALAPACTKKEAGVGGGQHARVIMRDGGTYSGTITASSGTQVTLAGDDNATHILAMKDVRSINYDDAAAPASAAAAPAGSAPAPPVAAQPGNAPPPPASPPAKSVPPAASAPPAAEPETAHAEHYHPPEKVIQSKTFELPVGTEIRVRCEETIDSAKAVEGQTYAAEVARNVNDASGALVIPRGANAQIVIRSASKGGRFQGTSDLILDLQAVSIEGRSYRLSTADMVEKGKPGMGANKRTAEYTGGGAAIGAIIGAIAGGGKGAAIGAGSGAGAGAVTQAITKGGSIKIPVETVLTFKLDRPLRVVAR
jgi:hypothetical protein